MKKHLPTIMMSFVLLVGLFLLFYPTISNMYNNYLNNKLIGEYQQSCSDIKTEQYEQAKKDAVKYNEYRNNPHMLKELGLTYEDVLNISNNGIMGYLEIPKISVSLVIYHTTNEDYLNNGIGHMKETALPIGGESTHSVLAGHTGLPSAKLLTNIDHLKTGDVFYIHVLDEVLEYQIDNISVVEPHEVSRINVVNGKDYVTIVTCTPYGVNSHRLLVRGVRANSGNTANADVAFVQEDMSFVDIMYPVTFSFIGLCVIYLIVIKLIKVIKSKNSDKKEKLNAESK